MSPDGMGWDGISPDRSISRSPSGDNKKPEESLAETAQLRISPGSVGDLPPLLLFRCFRPNYFFSGDALRLSIVQVIN